MVSYGKNYMVHSFVHISTERLYRALPDARPEEGVDSVTSQLGNVLVERDVVKTLLSIWRKNNIGSYERFSELSIYLKNGRLSRETEEN